MVVGSRTTPSIVLMFWVGVFLLLLLLSCLFLSFLYIFVDVAKNCKVIIMARLVCYSCKHVIYIITYNQVFGDKKKKDMNCIHWTPHLTNFARSGCNSKKNLLLTTPTPPKSSDVNLSPPFNFFLKVIIIIIR